MAFGETAAGVAEGSPRKEPSSAGETLGPASLELDDPPEELLWG